MGRKRTTRTFNGDSRKIGGKTKIVRRRNNQGTIEKREIKVHNPDGTAGTAARFIARYFLTINGQQIRKSKTLAATTLEEAREELAQLLGNSDIFAQERELEKNQLKLQGVKEDIKKAVEAQAKKDAEERAAEADRVAVKIADAWPLYVASKKRPDSGARTLRGYEAQYKIFADWMREHHPDKPKLRDVSASTAEAFIDYIEQTRSRNTRNKYLTFLRTFWRVLRWNPDAQLTLDPWDGIKSLVLNPDTQHHRDLTLDEIRRIARTISSDEIKDTLSYRLVPADGRKTPRIVDLRGELLGAFCLAIYSGWRLGDVVTASWENIDLDLGTMAATPRKTARKYGWSVKTAIHPALRALLAAVPRKRRVGYILPTLADIYLNREPAIITNRFAEVLKAANIATTADASGEGGGTKRRVVVGFHSTRHFFKSWLSNHGVNDAVVEYLMVHNQGRVSASYYHDNLATIAKAVATLPFIPELAGGAEAPQNALQDAVDAECKIIQANDADATQARFRRFCDALDGMTPDELKKAADEIARRRADMV